MSLHLIKLCVGVDSVEELVTSWRRRKNKKTQKDLYHVTRMIPKERDALVDGGSLYWVIRGQVQARQKLVDIVPFRDSDGIRRCRLVLDSDVIATEWQPRRAFQGWRYYRDPPADLSAASDISPDLRRDLSELGLL